MDRHCQVIGGEKLPSAIGTSTVCSIVQKAIAVRAPDLTYSIEVRVVSASRLTAALTVNGKTLPEQNFAVMDHNLNATAVQHFANGLAEVIAGASQQ